MLHGESFSFFFFYAPTSALFCFSQSYLLGLSGARTRVELGCAPHWEGRGWAPTILCKGQSGAPGERMTKVRHGPLPSMSQPDCVPFWHCTQGRSLCLLGLSPSKQLVISACAQIGMVSSWSHTNSLFCCCLIVNHLTGRVNNCGLLYPHPEGSQVILLHITGHRWAAWQTSLGSQSEHKQDEFAFTHHCHLCPAWFVKLTEGHAVLKETKEKICFRGVNGAWW